MRIAMVSPFPEQPNLFRGGVEAAVSVLAKGLRVVEKVDVHIIGPSTGVLPAIEERDGMTLHWLPTGRLPGFIGSWTSFRKSIHNTLKKIQPDITHFQGFSGWVLGYDAPYVFTVHGIAERDMVYQGGICVGLRRGVIALVEQIGRKKCPHTVIISPYVLNEIGAHIRGKRYLIENPVDSDAFEVKRSLQYPHVLYVGRINRRKNIYGLIQAFILLKAMSPNAVLRLAGEPDDAAYLNECVQLVNEYRLQDSVYFLGKLDRKAVLGELSRAACLVVVSRQETAPIIVGEAMAACVPVIAAKLCGLPYMIEDGETGVLVDPNDLRQIAEKIHLVLSNPLMAAAMGEKAREVALKRFHVHVVARRTLALYREILSER